ncbi:MULTISPECIES: DNA-directed RNA polymerase subunit beta [unclassified Fusibacter]|uniref:DNA-directed RNA polymerase subunit beta n=1 Tax=unclassified Fusibacter TaxID=2624464 RepID=UPI0010114359|nr:MULTISPECIES: DNA-directed RNA polymerase subunit beta [unclassified Fusibacter]MCK8061684.1 DNA-directed RNA polymerase subunit beta [Fusibacter sp. A2]NPE21346.1 DNA-directed RNA polymerase subunit beta [Fusibacter sp. A1]RXV61763.1 DNA-directed RNA polymerase subunit beta [Fusibacter sp. A1]
MPQPVKLGRRERMSFSNVEQLLETPNLIEIQKKSYQWFLEQGLMEAFQDISPIQDYTGNLILEFCDYNLEMTPKYEVEECKERDVNYAVPLKVQLRFINKETGEVKEQKVFMGDFPLMTEKGTFIINGAERVIVSQLVRSPGPYYSQTIDKVGTKLYATTVIPNRGAWLEYETDSNDIVSVRIDRTRKLPVTVLARALGYGSDQEILELFGEDERLLKTLDKDSSSTQEEGLIEVYKKLRPGEPPTVDSANNLLNSLFFDAKRYDLAKVGRYKFTKKLSLSNRIDGRVAAERIVSPMTGEVLVEEGELITRAKAYTIDDSGCKTALVYGDDDKVVKIIGNHFVDITKYIDIKDPHMEKKVYFPVLKEILEATDDEDERIELVKERKNELVPKHILIDDIIASISYILNMPHNIGNTDDIDHLGNRRIRSVGELLQNQFRIGLSRMERVVRERMTIQDMESITPQALINIRPVAAAIKEFFGSSQLSQFMDQTNPLAELTNKRRLSALGPGGLSRERAGFEVRDVHYSHYGRMCPIETPEGPNIGLIGNLSIFARVNEYGFVETPYRVVDKETGIVTKDIVFITADIEEKSIVVPATEPIGEDGRFVHERIVGRRRHEIAEYPSKDVDYMEIAAQQMVSVATSMIPFLENDDANRALMGSNMQRQAVPLVKAQAPIIGTGMEYLAGLDSGAVVRAKNDGVIEYVSADEIVVKTDNKSKDRFKLLKFKRSNQGTCITQRPLVSKGDRVVAGEVIADGPSTENGEIALGANLLVGFMTWEGYNYEDAILLSEELVKDDVLSSIHIEEYESEARDTKLGPEEITRDIPNVGDDALKNLDDRGIIRIGAEVNPADIMVGKVTPKGETELTAEERLLRAIFGEKAREVRDTSLRVPHGENGIIVDVKIFTRENGDELPPGVNVLVRVYIAKKRKINVGDKMAGRHGNKGVISRILPIEDMPFLDDGTPIQIMLNPLGVPSRMNIGQVLEIHLGLAAKKFGWHVATPVFDGAKESQIMDLLAEAGYPRDGKLVIRDGRTGESLDNRVTVGYMYMLKLHHLVDDKLHARSTGPYSLVTQQPLGGKAQFGGQRFGEMEVWALEAYGAAHTLQEILTVKSDDVVGRVKAYEAIVKGENIPEPGVPESFKVLIKELQSIGLDVKVLRDDEGELQIEEDLEDVQEYDELVLEETGHFVDDTEKDPIDDVIEEDEEDDFIDEDSDEDFLL